MEKEIKKLLDENPFSLFREDEDYPQATVRFHYLIESFILDLERLQGEFAACGAADTDSREATAVLH